VHRGGQARDANRRASETRRRISRRFGDVSDLHPGLSSAGWSASKRTRDLDETWKRRIDRIRCVRGRRDSKPSPKVDTCTVRCEGLRSTRSLVGEGNEGGTIRIHAPRTGSKGTSIGFRRNFRARWNRTYEPDRPRQTSLPTVRHVSAPRSCNEGEAVSETRTVCGVLRAS